MSNLDEQKAFQIFSLRDKNNIGIIYKILEILGYSIVFSDDLGEYLYKSENIKNMTKDLEKNNNIKFIK